MKLFLHPHAQEEMEQTIRVRDGGIAQFLTFLYHSF